MAQKINDVFISYSRKDYVDDTKQVIPDNVVSKVKDALKAENISFWFDEEGVYSGQDFAEKIIANIETSKVFLYLSTANANQSRWTCREIASADEFGKPIVPVRIDNSRYNRNVMFRIAHLDYIEYYANPEKGMRDMLDAIHAHLKQIAADEQRKQEEEQRRKEEERRKKEEEEKIRKAEQERKRQEEEIRKKAEEQEALVRQIRDTCTQLNSEESKLELRHNELLLMLSRVTDQKKHDVLKRFIDNGSPIRKSLLEQNSELKEKMVGLDEAVKMLTGQRDKLSKDLEREREERMDLENNSTQGKRLHFIYAAVIGLLVIVFGYWLFNMSGTVSSLKDEVAQKQDTIEIIRKNVEENKLCVYEKPMSSENGVGKREEFTYTGYVDPDGHPDGAGKALYVNEDTFEGFFSHGQRKHGFYYSPTKDEAWEGDFDKDGYPYEDHQKCTHYSNYSKLLKSNK